MLLLLELRKAKQGAHWLSSIDQLTSKVDQFVEEKISKEGGKKIHSESYWDPFPREILQEKI